MTRRVRVHDADLCDRIKKLEEKVRELEARPAYNCGHYHWYYPYTTYPPYTFTWNGTSGSNVTYNTIDNINDATNTTRES